MKIKQGISLIVLVITIIVMVILAGAIILTLNNNGIINKASEAVDVTNEASVRAVAQMAWTEAYLNPDITQEELDEYILNKLREQKINVGEYAIKVTENGVSVVKSVVDVVDTVPIPKGFVASGATGENKKDGGLVIYEGITPVTDANVEEAKRTRNQYVWVPVEDFSKFIRGAYDGTNYSNEPGTGTWEVVLDLTTNMPDIEENKKYSQYITSTTLAEVQAMYESVKEYKGFYIARYEAGLDIGKQKTSDDGIIIKEVHSKMNKAPYNYVRWTYNNAMDEDTNGAVEIARSIYTETNEKYGVVSTLTYGVQWDRTLAWWIETKAQNGTKDVIIDTSDKLNDSTLYGNYKNNEIPNSTFNAGASKVSNYPNGYKLIDSSFSKTSDENCFFTTGATEEARVNNIYDMAGNIMEWTMEGQSSSARYFRGGSLQRNGDTYSVSKHTARSILLDTVDRYHGFRPALYIK